MSANPSIVFYQGRRCTKIPRKQRATTLPPPPSTETDSSSPVTSEGSADSSSSRETLPSDRPTTSTTFTTSTTVAPATITSIDSAPDSSPSQTAELLPSATSIHAMATDTATSQTIVAPETSTTIQTTSFPEPYPSVSDDDSTGPPYAAIFGGIFGGLGIIALVALITLFILRCRRQRSDGCWSAQGRLRDDRGSAVSRTSLHRDYQLQMSYLPDALLVPPPYDHKTGDLAKVPDGPDSSVVPFVMQSSAIAAVNQGPTQPEESHATYRDSIQSGTSLGSTLILPGRSSMGSDYYQRTRLSFAKPPENGPAFPSAVTRNSNRRSDPFDLDPASVSRRKSGTMPVALL